MMNFDAGSRARKAKQEQARLAAEETRKAKQKAKQKRKNEKQDTPTRLTTSMEALSKKRKRGTATKSGQTFNLASAQGAKVPKQAGGDGQAQKLGGNGNWQAQQWQQQQRKREDQQKHQDEQNRRHQQHDREQEQTRKRQEQEQQRAAQGRGKPTGQKPTGHGLRSPDYRPSKMAAAASDTDAKWRLACCWNWSGAVFQSAQAQLKRYRDYEALPAPPLASRSAHDPAISPAAPAAVRSAKRARTAADLAPVAAMRKLVSSSPPTPSALDPATMVSTVQGWASALESERAGLRAAEASALAKVAKHEIIAAQQRAAEQVRAAEDRATRAEQATTAATTAVAANEAALATAKTGAAGQSAKIAELHRQLVSARAELASLKPELVDLTAAASGLAQLHQAQQVKVEATEDRQDEGQYAAQFIDKLQSKIDRLKEIAANAGVDHTIIDAA